MKVFLCIDILADDSKYHSTKEQPSVLACPTQ